MSDSVKMVNVYQIAADIGKDFEKLIELNGSEQFRELMPKIIQSLEYLETAIKTVDTQNAKIEILEAQVITMTKESEVKENDNTKYVKEIEQTTKMRMDEDQLWMEKLSELEKENSFLKEQVYEKHGLAVREKVQEQEALKVLVMMKQTVDNQRNQIYTLSKEVTQKTADIDALQQHIERLVKLNQSLHQKNAVIQRHAQSLMEEKAHLITEIKVMDKERPAVEPATSTVQQTGDNQTKESRPSTDGMIMIDPKDPNRPRFTLNELYTVLLERDELKLKLFVLEDKLSEETGNEDISDSLENGDKKSESKISKFFSSLFRTSKKRRDSNAKELELSENSWQLVGTTGVPSVDNNECNQSDKLEMSEFNPEHFGNGVIKHFPVVPPASSPREIDETDGKWTGDEGDTDEDIKQLKLEEDEVCMNNNWKEQDRNAESNNSESNPTPHIEKENYNDSGHSQNIVNQT